MSGKKALYRDIWNSIRAGDQEALVSLYKNLYQYLLNTGRNFTEDQHQLKDTIQQLFLDLWEQRDRLPEVMYVKGYMARALKNRLLNVLKKTPQFITVDEEYIQEEFSEVSYLEKILAWQEDEVLRGRLRSSLSKLTPRQLELLEMRFYQQMSYEEIEAALDISRKTIYNIIFNALEILREDMKDTLAKQ